jgi:hypothetical protein
MKGFSITGIAAAGTPPFVQFAIEHKPVSPMLTRLAAAMIQPDQKVRYTTRSNGPAVSAISVCRERSSVG